MTPLPLANMLTWWNRKAGDQALFTCQTCGKSQPATWIDVSSREVPESVGKWRRDCLEKKQAADTYKVIASIGFWRPDSVCCRHKVVKRQEPDGMPVRFASVEWDGFTQTPENATAIARVRAWIDGLPRPAPFGLFLYSETPGTGKTTLACLALRSAAAKGVSGAFLRAADVTALDAERASDYSRCRALVIDDFGKIRGTDFGVERLFDLLDTRHANLLPTILTANQGPDEIAQKYGVSLASRVCDAASFRVVRLGGEDRRMRS